MGRTLEQRIEVFVDFFLAHLRSDVVLGADMNRRTALRVGDRDDRLFLRVLDLNQRGRILSNMTAVRDDECHRFAHIGHPPIGERGSLHLGRDEEKVHHVDLEAGQVLLSVDGMYAGNLARRVRIDGENIASRDRTACERDMQHARQRDVVDELAAAGQQAWIFLAADALADVASGANTGGVHDSSPTPAPASFFATRRMP